MKSKEKWSIVIIVCCLLFAVSNMFFLAKNESATTDEKVHIPAGISYYKYNNLFLNPEHPPLAKLIIGLPAYLQNINYPDSTKLFDVAKQYYYDSWVEQRLWGEQLLYQSNNDAQKIIFSSRVANIIVTIFLILFLVYWAYIVGGKKSAVVAAILASFQPLILAHGHLGNTDILITFLFTILCFSWWKYLQYFQKKWLYISAVIFGLTALTKFTFIIFIPVLLVSYLICKKCKNIKINTWQLLLEILIFCVITFCMVAICYRTLDIPPKWQISSTSQYNLNQKFGEIINTFRFVMIPSLFFKGLVMVLTHAVGGHGSFLLGEFSKTGWWYYFPITILLKTPIGFLGLIGFAFYKFKESFAKHKELIIILTSGIIIYLLFAMASRANLGQRHIMPIYPLLIIMASIAVNFVKKSKSKIIISIMLAITVLSVSFNFKNQIAYFNELVGGTKYGYKYLLDSNYDWGQSFQSIAKYIKKNNLQDFYITYGWANRGEFEYYGVLGEPLENFDPYRNSTIIVDPDAYQKPENDWLKSLPVKDRIDNTVFVLEYKARN